AANHLDDPDVWLTLCRFRGEHGNAPDAVNACNRATALDPGSAEAFSDQAHALQRIGQFNDAREAFHACVEASPAAAQGWADLSARDACMGRCAGAESAARRALGCDRETRYAQALRAH